MEEKKDDFIEIKSSDYKKNSGNKNNFYYTNLNRKAEGACCQGNIKILLGGLAFFLGLFYLGQNFDWWNFNLEADIFWPVLLIILGLSVIFKQKIPRSLLWIFISFAFLILILSLLTTSSSEHQINKDEEPHSFFGNYDRTELEYKIEEALDDIYEEEEKRDIGVTIEDM